MPNFGVLTLARALASVDPGFPVAAVVAVAAIVAVAADVRLALVGLAVRVAVARWRPCVVCPFPF